MANPTTIFTIHRLATMPSNQVGNQQAAMVVAAAAAAAVRTRFVWILTMGMTITDMYPIHKPRQTFPMRTIPMEG